MYNPTYILQKHFKPPTKLFSDENQCTKSVLVLKGSGSERDFFTAIQEFYLNEKIMFTVVQYQLTVKRFCIYT